MNIRLVPWCIIILLTCVVGTAQGGEDISVATAPPVVVKTYPMAGDLSVDPTIKEIRVTFSKDMITEQMWSWVIASPGSFPKIAGEVKYLKDKRTCVAPVSLEPDKTYAIWFNSSKHNAFRDLHNNPAIPYMLVFHTKK